MNDELLQRLRAPGTGQPLIYDRDQQLLRAESSGEGGDPQPSWPVIDGIPRLVRSEHLESFGRQWNRYEVAHDEEDRATFEAKTGVRLGELQGLTVLDAGCGGGRYCKVAGEAGAQVIGVDHSTAVEKARQLCSHLPNVSFVQADLKRLPFEPASFDMVFSIGVLHHDVATYPALKAVSGMVRPGGTYSVWLYRRNQAWQEWLNSAVRCRTMNMPPDRLERLCRMGAFLGGVPVIKKTLNKVLNFSAHPDAENRLCDTFDWYAPQYQHHHTVTEVTEWFRNLGFTGIEVLPPEKTGRFYHWAYEKNLLIGSGVNVKGTRSP